MSKREFGMVYDFEASVRGSIVELKFSETDAIGVEAELLAVFDSVRLQTVDPLETNLSWANLSAEEKNENPPAHLTLKMAKQAHIVVTAERSRNHHFLLKGKKTLAACGFPELYGHGHLDD